MVLHISAFSIPLYFISTALFEAHVVEETWTVLLLAGLL